MPQITYVERGGKAHILDVAIGLSVMEGGVMNGLPGIDADGGGACACAPARSMWMRPGSAPCRKKSPTEAQILEFAYSATANRRMSCQPEVTAALERLCVTLLESQHLRLRAPWRAA